MSENAFVKTFVYWVTQQCVRGEWEDMALYPSEQGAIADFPATMRVIGEREAYFGYAVQDVRIIKRTRTDIVQIEVVEL